MRLLDLVHVFARVMARFRLHRVEVPFGLHERRMHFLLPAETADFIFVVNDVATPFGDVEYNSQIIRVPIPRPRAVPPDRA